MSILIGGTSPRAVWENPSDVSPASDVYSLGLVFYQLITGQPPLHDVEAVLAGKGPAIDVDLLIAKLSRKGSPDFMSDPAGAAEVIGRMCAPQRSERYATLAEALDDLAICEAVTGNVRRRGKSFFLTSFVIYLRVNVPCRR